MSTKGYWDGRTLIPCDLILYVYSENIHKEEYDLVSFCVAEFPVSFRSFVRHSYKSTLSKNTGYSIYKPCQTPEIFAFWVKVATFSFLFPKMCVVFWPMMSSAHRKMSLPNGLFMPWIDGNIREFRRLYPSGKAMCFWRYVEQPILQYFLNVFNFQVSVCMCVPEWAQVPGKARRGHPVLWGWSYSELWVSWHGSWELNSSLVQEQQLLFTTELFF